MPELILERKYDYSNRLFAICESCYWTATIFTKIEGYNCPACLAANVSLIPLSLDEKYEFQFRPERGLDVKFSINEEIKK